MQFSDLTGQSVQADRRNTDMERIRKKTGIIRQVARLFAAGVMLMGLLTYVTQYISADKNVKLQTEDLSSDIADEVSRYVKQYPAYEWLVKYWYENSETMDIEYDADFGEGTQTEQKCRILSSHHPELQLRYADTQEIEALSEEDQKLYAEIIYSWLITRIDQIKRTYNVDYLFCVITDDTFKTQFFLFSGADEDSVRGTNYEEVYTLGVLIPVGESQQNAMRSAVSSSGYLADAGNYADYYALLDEIDGKYVLTGLTFDLSDLRADIFAGSLAGTRSAIIYQICLSLFFMMLMYYFVLRPLTEIQQNIRLYKESKDSKAVEENLSEIHYSNEIGQLSEDVVGMTKEIDDYLGRIENITAEKERIVTELSLATRIQADMLPNVFPAFPEHNEFDVYATMDPAREVGGDFYDFFLIDNDHLCLVIADVSGKGVPAALFMMASKIILSNNAMMGKSPAKILEDTNNAICSNNREEMFVTVWLGILELSTGKLTAANAGHEYPALMRRGGVFEMLKDRHGFIIGGMEGMKYHDYEMVLQPGDKLFLYTDGLVEAMDPQNHLFTTERMLEVLNRDTGASPQKLLENVSAGVEEFVQNADQFDDLTMLCISYNGPINDGKEITVEAKVENIGIVTSFVNDELSRMDCPEKAKKQIDIAIDELFGNISRYSYVPESGEATVRVESEDGRPSVFITFIDQGKPFDPLNADDPDTTLSAEERQIGGLGVFLVKQIMDDVQYEYKDGSNILRIRKNLSE